jgi:succinate dehydrogenase flavin-adding protein (antitoxin of CptAB toxin-antitoxin module)
MKKVVPKKKTTKKRPPLKTKAAILKAIKDSNGIISNIAERLKVGWITAKKWIDADPDLTEAWLAEKESVTDIAENKLIEQINSSEQWAVKFWLATMGKKRGFTERHEVTGPEGEPVEINLNSLNEKQKDELTELLAKVNEP